MSQKHSFQMVKSPGEAFVWFSSMGLTIGLIMVAGLLVVIISHGVKVFWPDQVAQIQLKKGSSAALGESPYLAGRIIEKRQKAVKSLDQKDNNSEWQLFIGNKDIYGLAFRFVDYKNIEKVTYPKDIISIERLEYGDAIGIPQSLEIKGQQPLQYSDPS